MRSRSPSDSSQMVLSLPTVFSKLVILVACGVTTTALPCSYCGRVFHLSLSQDGPFFILNACQRYCHYCLSQTDSAATGNYQCLIKMPKPYTRWLVSGQRNHLLWATKGLISELPGSPHLFTASTTVGNFHAFLLHIIPSPCPRA